MRNLTVQQFKIWLATNGYNQRILAEKHIKHDEKAMIIEWLEQNLPSELEYS